MPQEYGPRGLPATFSCLFWHLFWKSLSLLQGRLQTYPTSLAGNSSVKQNGVEGICSYYWQPVTAVMCCMLTACSAPQSAWDGRHACAKEPAICARAGRSGGAPCQQHCPKASWQQSRRAGHSIGPTPGPPEPCLVLASGLMVY